MSALWKFAKIALMAMGGLFALFIVVGLMGGWDKRPADAVGATALPAPPPTGRISPVVEQPKTPAPRPAQRAQPAIETAFVATVVEARERYGTAANDMAKGGARAARKTAICRVLSNLGVTEWVGKIYSLSSNSDGAGVIEIAIGPDTYVKTWNNALSDLGDQTLIPAQSALFQVLSAMKT